ncbi:hypothetical protein EC991_001476 [Linnemannia zychae]|nr:hypothetical protein EC991_001476 [Linnemannia zychae]
MSDYASFHNTRDSQAKQWALLLTELEKITGNLQLAGRRYEGNEIQSYIQMRVLLPFTLDDSSISSRYGRAIGQGARLRTFEWYGYLHNDRLMLLLPLLPCLVKLKLSIIHLDGGPLKLARILRDCPRLEQLCIRNEASWGASRWKEDLPGPWVFNQPTSGYSLYTITSPLALKSLVLYGMSLYQSTLHTLLEYTPHLKEINIVSARLLGAFAFNFADFNRHIEGLPFRLEYFHFSTRDEAHSGVTSDLCPSPHQRTLGSCDFTSAILPSLRLEPNTITTLELFHRDNLENSAHLSPREYVLHNYLCSSPHLLHLKALNYEYPIEHMDLHGRIVKTLANQERNINRFAVNKWTPGQPGIWACRKLRTLHLKITTPDLRARRTTSSHSEYGRVAFGYIARVCPELRDFALGSDLGFRRIGLPSLDFHLQGGFCLLARLKHLESVGIAQFFECSALTPINFEWMLESGRTKEKQAERQVHLQETWKRLRLWDNLHRTSVATGLDTDEDNGVEITHFDWTGVDLALREELKYLGWAIEVQTFFDELGESIESREGLLCFPALRYSSICSLSGFDMSPEEDYKRFIHFAKPQGNV